MELPKSVEKYKRPISFVIAILVVTGSFFAGWLLTVLSPIFVFLVFKFLMVWKTKERLGLGIPAIIIGIVLFFFIFSYQVANVEMQEFSNNGVEIKIVPYSTTDFNHSAKIDVTVNEATNEPLYYQINNTVTGKTVASGSVNGTVSNGHTHYTFTVNPGKGIYAVKIIAHNKPPVYGEIIRERPNQLFQYFIYYSGGYIIVLLSILYSLFIFGVYIIRRNKELMRLRYEKGA